MLFEQIKRLRLNQKITNSLITICELNVRGRLNFRELDQFLIRNKIDLAVLTETKKKNCYTQFLSKNYIIFHSGGKNAKRGVCFVCHNRLIPHINSCKAINENVIALDLVDLQDFKNLSVYGIYMPDNGCSKTSVVEIYEILSGKCKENFLLLGDFNSRVGKIKSNCLGKFNRDSKANRNGLILVDFCEKNNLVICNTFFSNNKCTWSIDKYKTFIDYLIVPSIWQNKITKFVAMKTKSDHRAIIFDFNIKTQDDCNS